MVESATIPFFSIYISLCYAFFLFLLSFYTTRFRKFDALIVNLASGLMFAYLFLTLLPEIYHASSVDPVELMAISFFMFVGFIGFYIAEKKLFEDSKRRGSFQMKLFEIRKNGFYIIHFITGYLIVYTFASKSIAAALFLMIPFTFHIVSTSILFEDVEKWQEGAVESRILFPILIVVGAISAEITSAVLKLDLIYFYAFFAGTFIYLVMTILTPEHKRGTLSSFLFGIFLYFMLLVVQSYAI
jgi:hypothetical protein